MKLGMSHHLTLEEIAHIEKSLEKMHHLITIAHNEMCHEFTTCHPLMATFLRDLITACIEQGKSLSAAHRTVNQMYRTILEGAADEQKPC